ncbi:MAG: hypothetical protein PF481_11385, partial [Bacteroidales bacterium]|nr:hypothetical protein [Bacteroidales bacterium]
IDVFLNGFGTGAWAVDGATAGINSSGVFDPSFNGAATQTHEVSYAYTDGKGCRDTAREDVTVQFTPAPTTVGHLSITMANETLEVKATNLEPGANIKWYETTISTPAVSTDNPYQVLSIPGSQEIDTTLYVTQTVNGCESERAEADISIYDCPVPAPDVNIASPICVYEDTPPVEAVISSGWLEGIRPTGVAPEFRFYDSETATTPLETNTTGEYVPTITKTATGNFTFWVSEYNDNVVPQGCEGPRTPVTIKVYKVWKPVVADVEAVCVGAPNNTFTAQDAVGTVEWYDETEPVYPATGATPVSSGVTYTPNFTTVGSHMVYAINTKEVEPGTTCVSEADGGSIEIKAIPAPPTTTPAEICLNEPNIPVCATPADPTGYINWYETTKLQTNQDCYTPLDKTMPGEYTLYATETVNDCESEKAPVEYTIKLRPDAPIIDPQENLCIYDDDPVLQATGQNITWYENGASITPSYTNTYTHVIAEAGNIEYKATQTVDGCEGSKRIVSFRIIGEVQAPTAGQKYMCEGGAVPILESDGSSTQWYSDEAAQSLQKIGFTYQPNISLLGVGENEFYMLNLTTVGGKTCFSDTASVTLYVTDNCSDTSAPYFRQTLGELIDSAEILLASAEEEELKTMRLYQSGAIAFLESEKASAQEVYDDSYATQTEIDAAVEQLKQAITDFHAMDITAISNVDDMPFVLYPNPADDYITISQGSSNSAISHIIIKNPAHIPVLETTKTHIDVSALPRGTYICEIYTAEGVWIKLLVLK